MRHIENKIEKEIKVWTRIAAFVPVVLFLVFTIIWYIGDDMQLSMTTVSGKFILVGLITVWWLSTLYIISKLACHWIKLERNIKEVYEEIQHIKKTIGDVLHKSNK